MPTMTRAGYVPPKAEPPKAPQGKPGKKKKRKKKGLNAAAAVSLLIFAAAVLIGVGTVYVYLQTQPYLQAFVPGTMLLGYPLAGIAQEDAYALMDTIGSEYVNTWQCEIACMGNTYTLTAQDIGLAIDREATIAPLWAAGREGGMLTRYLDMLRLEREPLVQQPVLAWDLAVLDEMLEIIRSDAECAPVDATVTYHPGHAEPFEFTDEETGYTLDFSGVRSRIEQGVKTLTPVSITLEPETVEPAVYRAVLENALSLRVRLTVPLERDDASVHNVKLAAVALNGLRIDAGDTLSFNEAVGRRTQENGYLSAPEPAYGEDVSGVGGGVCQAATVLYRAALLGGVEVAERSCAARPVSYCDMGQEAAVSDQGLDLVLRNQTESPMFISARVYEDGDIFLELMLIGEALSKRYALESLVDETGMIEEPVYVRDREGRYAVYSDERVPVGRPLQGYSAGVDRVTLDSEGTEIARETVSENIYEAVPPMIYVGVQEREEE